MKFAVEHIGMAARDPVTLKDWYVRVLGARLVFDDGQKPPAVFLELSGGLLLEIYAASSISGEASNNRLAGWRHMALRVDSIEAARDELIARGVKFIDPIKPAGGGGRVLFFNDAENNLLHLTERPGDSIFRR
jgi:catechol 2,3-dioxygenase-like lactoylglutathione lyase family enzyme